MNASIKLIISHKSGAPTTVITVEAPIKVEGTPLDDHDLAGVFFAAEFAINDCASAIVSKPVRAHFFLE